MPAEDISDLRDVVDAINKLCETMKTSYDEYEDSEDQIVQDVANSELIDPTEVLVDEVETYVAERWCYRAAAPQPAPAVIKTMWADESIEPHLIDNLVPEKVEPYVRIPQMVDSNVTESWRDTVIEPVASPPAKTAPQSPTTNDIEVVAKNVVTERWSDRFVEEFEHVSDSEPAIEQLACEPMSEMYYTASSEVSLLSDVDLQDKAQSEDSDKDRDDRNSVMAGHVAAMRERFESMTRTNTPCPDLIRSVSPSFEVFRNFSTSPDHLE